MNRWMSLSVACLFLAGCNPGGGPKVATHKVTGKVTLNGAPVAGATVTFSPDTKGNPAAMGLTDTTGVYVLQTYDPGDGAAEGDYKVIVYKVAENKSSEPATPAHDPTGSGPSAPPSHSRSSAGSSKSTGNLLPDKYAKVDTTPLKRSVVAGKNTIDLEL